MPYIEQECRRELFDGRAPETPGELNFAVTRLLTIYLGDRPSYTMYNEVIGVLECAKLELYRRMIAPYEAEKCKANGDVYAPVSR